MQKMTRRSSKADTAGTAPIGRPDSGDSFSLAGLPRHDIFNSVEEAVAGLSLSLTKSVDARFIASFFDLNDGGKLDLPPKPRQDSALCEKLAGMMKRLHVPAGMQESTTKLIRDMFESAANRTLSSYELQVMEFVLENKHRIALFVEPLTRSNAIEVRAGGEVEVYIGRRMHSRRHELRPDEAFGIFIHESAHARDRLLHLHYLPVDRDTLSEKMVREVRANTYEARGDINEAIRRTSIRYGEEWGMLIGVMPGFNTLPANDKYHYVSILADHRVDDRGGYIAAHGDLVRAFPQLAKELLSYAEKTERWAGAQSDEFGDVLSELGYENEDEHGDPFRFFRD